MFVLYSGGPSQVKLWGLSSNVQILSFWHNDNLEYSKLKHYILNVLQKQLIYYFQTYYSILLSKLYHVLFVEKTEDTDVQTVDKISITVSVQVCK